MMSRISILIILLFSTTLSGCTEPDVLMETVIFFFTDCEDPDQIVISIDMTGETNVHVSQKMPVQYYPSMTFDHVLLAPGPHELRIYEAKTGLSVTGNVELREGDVLNIQLLCLVEEVVLHYVFSPEAWVTPVSVLDHQSSRKSHEE